jgi:hypothetical protein
MSTFAVRARDGRWFTLRFECTNYPIGLPTACVWDLERSARRSPWSAGREVAAGESPPCSIRLGKSGTALYLPCDREAMLGHDAWPTTLPELIWRPIDGIAQYLEIVYELLNSYDYTPAAVSAP